VRAVNDDFFPIDASILSLLVINPANSSISETMIRIQNTEVSINGRGEAPIKILFLSCEYSYLYSMYTSGDYH